jgi:hypothetical protein
MCSVTLTHETRSPTPPDKQKKVRLSLFSRARMFPSLEFALAFATTRSRSGGFIRDPAHIRTVSPFFLSFFFAVCLVCPSFSEFAVSRRRASKKKRIERERERERKKDDLSLEIKTDDSMRDARDSSARRTIFGSRALPLSPLSDLIIFLVRFPLTHLLRSHHPGTLAHLIILYL